MPNKSVKQSKVLSGPGKNCGIQT